MVTPGQAVWTLCIMCVRTADWAAEWRHLLITHLPPHCLDTGSRCPGQHQPSPFIRSQEPGARSQEMSASPSPASDQQRGGAQSGEGEEVDPPPHLLDTTPRRQPRLVQGCTLYVSTGCLKKGQIQLSEF